MGNDKLLNIMTNCRYSLSAMTAVMAYHLLKVESEQHFVGVAILFY